jgi:AcrR family transcriptional regulator
MVLRISKDYDERKAEILDAAQELFFTLGYEQTSVNAIIEKVGVAKGTFYYYFKSKEELLDCLAERISEQALSAIMDLVDNPDMNAIEKFNSIFARVGAVKTANRKTVIALMSVLYRDENIQLRHKMSKGSLDAVVPYLAEVVVQGVSEGLFDTEFPYESTRLVMMLSANLTEDISEILLKPDLSEQDFDLIEKTYRVCEFAIERILGAKKGSIKMVSRKLISNLLSDNEV